MGSRVRFWAATALVGVAAGVAGVILTLLLHLVQHTLFGYSENTFLIGVERASRARRIWAPALGGLVAGLGWWWSARRWPGRLSIPDVLRDRSRLPLGRALADSLLQIVAVGTGASMGREGAPRQAGAAAAGWIADRLAIPAEQRRTLIACGAGAGLAAVYNVPVAGALFTLEILLVSRRWHYAVPALATSLIATAVAWPVLSAQPTYHVAGATFAWSMVVAALALGPVTGVLGLGFARLMALARRRAPRGAPAVVTVMLSFAAIGALAGAYPTLLGNGKGLAQISFTGTLALGTALALTLLKPAATALTLGAGAVGGLLTPAFATGAAFGLAAALLWAHVWGGGSTLDLALAGAAALLAVTQRAPLTATVLTLELTHCGPGGLPAIVVAVLSATGVEHALRRRVAPRPRDTEAVEPTPDTVSQPRVVVAGALVRATPAGPRLLAARRSRPADVAGRWELPGGKVEAGETSEEALVREIGEELGLHVDVAEWLDGESPIRDGLILRAAVVRGIAGEPRPAAGGEHDAVRWLAADEIGELDWLEPDRPFLPQLILRLGDVDQRTERAVFFDEDAARSVAGRLVGDGWSADVRRERYQGEDDDEDHPWAVLTDAPPFALELLVEEFDGWLDIADGGPPAPAPLDLPSAPQRIKRPNAGSSVGLPDIGAPSPGDGAAQ